MTRQDEAEIRDWAKKLLGEAVQELMAAGILESELVEAKPAWAFPYEVLVGKIREQGSGNFAWFICGNVPTDYVSASLAATPRDACRHFALKWHLDAEKSDADKEDIVKSAQALYQVVDDDSLWPA